MSVERVGRYATVEETQVYYEAWGDPEDPPLVCVHTAGAEGRQWEDAAPLLAERGHHVVVPDLPGHGKSYPLDWEPTDSIHAHAESVWSLVEELDLDTPAVAGCSIGGDTALDLAVHHADDLRGVAALEGAARTHGPAMGALKHPHACPGWQNVLEYSVADSTGDDCGETVHRKLEWVHRSAQEVATSDLQGWREFDVRDRLDEATVPVLLVRGEDDFYIQDDVFAATREGLPDCEAVTLEGVGHYPMLEAPERTASLIGDFLE